MESGWKQKRNRSEQEFSRRAGNRPQRQLFLIVCEDSKSTPNYLKELRIHLRMSTAEVEVCGKECGSAPINVIDYAIQRREERRLAKNPADHVWCVVDVDTHTTLDPALDKARPHKLKVAVSSPCLELWYLIHFVPGDRHYKTFDQLKPDLKKHLPGYNKGKSSPFATLWPLVGQAIKNARRLCSLRDQDPARQSYTQLHLLIEELQGNVG